jgi:hypothetical protein
MSSSEETPMPMRWEFPLPIMLTAAVSARDADEPADDGFLAVAVFCAIGLLDAVIAMSCGVQGVWL